ncbi:hypothetical protein ISF_08121 [Cordyceps fumosorosea ARSEF 2679]|uniref:Integral membrane protein n=1 Tax=Cordyceps fumosorosea (strain ARSEF 2679) TaxID=1081104 RepID=A0A162MEV0_CORFA|nr:hypothetical protein ISF_08121 [Cordyceps fumosorosea ARSEF 2679]OAA55200.1 hypothetical protein ISF_08121 [Cordyceps fumosorosea ARSEF 2679]
MATVKPMRSCPGRSATDVEQNWYHMRLAPGLGICSACYHQHILPTPFASNFAHEPDSSGARRYCDFDVPRTRAVLRQALADNDIAAFQAYWTRRAGTPRCKGAGAGVAPADGFSWFQLAEPLAGGKQLGACNACYEDHVLASPFAERFASTPVKQPQDQTFECDLAWEFVQKLLCGGTQDWAQVSSWLLFRKGLPRCLQAAAGAPEERRWHRLRAPEFGALLTCEACYYDAVHGTVAAEHFLASPVVLPPGSLTVVCMVGGHVALRVVLDEAKRLGDWAVFHRAAQAVVRNPPCLREGTQSQVWYSVVPASPEIDVCPACHACLFEALGAGHLLQPKYVPPGQPRLCSMNLAAPHVAAIYRRLDMALDSGDLAGFASFLRLVAELPACPGNKPVAGLRWYTHDLFSCCPACWHTAPIRDTKLAQCFASETEVSSLLKCDFYSGRVRDLWRLACIEDDLAGFAGFMKKRHQIWQQTYPAIQQQLAIMRMNLQRQSTLMMASVLNTGANNIVSAASPVGLQGHYGNSAIGYGYETMAGAQGAIQFNQATSMGGANAAPAMVITQLEGLWKSVE